jgi:hypothetical protein
VAARIAVAVIAVLAAGWLAVMERDHRLHADGARVLAMRDPSGAQLRQAEQDLRRASLLNPDTRPDLDRALVLVAQGRADSGKAVVEDVVRREPDNLLVWGVAAVLARGRDQALLDRAFAARKRLDPVNAR